MALCDRPIHTDAHAHAQDMTRQQNLQLQQLYENSTVALAETVEKLSAALTREYTALEEQLQLLAAQFEVSDELEGKAGEEETGPKPFQWARPQEEQTPALEMVVRPSALRAWRWTWLQPLKQLCALCLSWWCAVLLCMVSGEAGFEVCMQAHHELIHLL